MAKLTPGYISFHITNRCDCRCAHCEIWKTSQPEAPPSQDFARVVDELADWLGPVSVIVAGGEPMLAKPTFSILARCKARNMSSSISTNGFSIDAEKAHRLAEGGLHIANVSLDGFDHTHDRIRNRPGAFAKVIESITLLDQAGINVHISCVIMEDNLDQITGLIDFLTKQTPVSGIFFQAMAQPFGANEPLPGWWRRHPLFPKDTKRVPALLDELLAMKQGGFYILNEDVQLMTMKAYFANPERFTLTTCTVGENGLGINAAGDVLLCNFMGPVGNITQGHIRDIYESAKAKAVRERMHQCKDNCHLLINCCFDLDQIIHHERGG